MVIYLLIASALATAFIMACCIAAAHAPKIERNPFSERREAGE